MHDDDIRSPVGVIVGFVFGFMTATALCILISYT